MLASCVVRWTVEICKGTIVEGLEGVKTCTVRNVCNHRRASQQGAAGCCARCQRGKRLQLSAFWSVQGPNDMQLVTLKRREVGSAVVKDGEPSIEYLLLLLASLLLSCDNREDRR